MQLLAYRVLVEVAHVQHAERVLHRAAGAEAHRARVVAGELPGELRDAFARALDALRAFLDELHERRRVRERALVGGPLERRGVERDRRPRDEDRRHREPERRRGAEDPQAVPQRPPHERGGECGGREPFEERDPRAAHQASLVGLECGGVRDAGLGEALQARHVDFAEGGLHADRRRVRSSRYAPERRRRERGLAGDRRSRGYMDARGSYVDLRAGEHPERRDPHDQRDYERDRRGDVVPHPHRAPRVWGYVFEQSSHTPPQSEGRASKRPHAGLFAPPDSVPSRDVEVPASFPGSGHSVRSGSGRRAIGYGLTGGPPSWQFPQSRMR